jgi:hypothetical protein
MSVTQEYLSQLLSAKATWRTAQARLPFADKATVLATLRNSPETMKDTFRVIAQLQDTGVIERYAVAGALGAMFYTEAARTLDIDFLVSLPAAATATLSPFSQIFAWLALHGYTQFLPGGLIQIEGWPVQFLPAAVPFTQEALACAVRLPYDDITVPVVRAEYLAAEALRLSRPKDIARLDSLRRSEGFDQALFQALIARFGLENQYRKILDFLGE